MKILTVIVTYNSMRWIDRCLDALAHSTMPTDVIVIDNCSTDGTREHIPSSYPHVIFKPQEHNLGFGQGNNIGLRYALQHNYDYALLLNQDAYLSHTALQMLTLHSDGSSLMSPIHLNGNGTDYDHNFLTYTLRQSCPEYLDDVSKGMPKPYYNIGEVCAACWLMPRALIEKIGGFNPLFSQYGEDNNYYHRMLYHGIKTRLVTSATVRHDRKIQGNMAVFSKGQIAREFLLASTNPNLSLLQSLHRMLFLVKKYRSTPLQVIRALSSLIRNAARIRSSRNTDKRVSTNWL